MHIYAYIWDKTKYIKFNTVNCILYTVVNMMIKYYYT